MTYARVLGEHRALIGTPDEIVEQMRYLEAVFGRIDVPNNWGRAERSVHLRERKPKARGP